MKKLTHVFSVAVALVGLALPALAADATHEKVPGFVDGSMFLELAGDDGGTVEVSLHGALLRALLGIDPELKKLAGGLESIQAVIIEPTESTRLEEMLDLVRRTEGKLLDRGWERLARVKEGDANVSVLVLNDEDAIQGLVVLVVDEENVVFANVAGIVDLAAIAALGEQLDIPGLDQIGK